MKTKRLKSLDSVIYQRNILTHNKELWIKESVDVLTCREKVKVISNSVIEFMISNLIEIAKKDNINKSTILGIEVTQNGEFLYDETIPNIIMNIDKLPLIDYMSVFELNQLKLKMMLLNPHSLLNIEQHCLGFLKEYPGLQPYLLLELRNQKYSMSQIEELLQKIDVSSPEVSEENTSYFSIKILKTYILQNKDSEFSFSFNFSQFSKHIESSIIKFIKSEINPNIESLETKKNENLSLISFIAPNSNSEQNKKIQDLLNYIKNNIQDIAQHSTEKELDKFFMKIHLDKKLSFSENKQKKNKI